MKSSHIGLNVFHLLILMSVHLSKVVKNALIFKDSTKEWCSYNVFLF